MSRKSEKTFADFLEVLGQFDTAMLVTREKSGMLAGRPMAIADRTSAGHLWFLTRVESSTIADITDNPEVIVCMQAGDRHLCVSGLARTTRDPKRIDALWKTGQSVWFEKGKNDPSLVLLEIVPTFGEYWDRSGADGVRFTIEQLSALLTGDTLNETAGRHGRVDFPDRTKD